MVSVAGAGRPIDEVLDDQLSRMLSPELLADTRRMMAELKAGRAVDSVPPQLVAIFRPRVQPYMISWLPIDPAREVGRLTVPVLVVQGTTDVQVNKADADRLANGQSHATLETIEGMNHVLKEVRESSQQTSSYSDPALSAASSARGGDHELRRSMTLKALRPRHRSSRMSASPTT